MRKARVLFVILGWLAAIGWAEHRFGAGPSLAFAASDSAPVSEVPEVNDRRQALVDWLDDLIQAEGEYRNQAHSYTAVLERLSLVTPDWIRNNYSVTVKPSGSRAFSVLVESEAPWDVGARIFIDEHSQWHASFPLPEPRHAGNRRVASSDSDLDFEVEPLLAMPAEAAWEIESLGNAEK